MEQYCKHQEVEKKVKGHSWKKKHAAREMKQQTHSDDKVIGKSTKTHSWKKCKISRETDRAVWGRLKKKKKGKDNNCPPSVALWFLKCVFTCLHRRRRAAQRASLAWCQTPSLLTRPNNHPAICTCSNYYPISNKYRTITARNPHTQAAAGCKNPGREKLVGSSNSSDQTAINQQRHLSVWGI